MCVRGQIKSVVCKVLYACTRGILVLFLHKGMDAWTLIRAENKSVT